MGTVIKILRRLFLTGLCIFTTYLIWDEFNYDSLCAVEESRYLLSEESPAEYELISDNQVITNLAGLSNCIIHLKELGYVTYSCRLEDSYADIIIQSQEDQCVYRYYYTYADRKLTCFCNVYENCWNGLTYILEEKE